MPLLAAVLCCGLFIGCSFSRATYNTQKLAADSVFGAVHGYNLYLGSATNQVTGANLDNLLAQRDKVYSDVRHFSQVEQTVTAARLAYQANKADTNKTALTVVLATLNETGDAIVSSVKTLIKGN